MIIFLNDTIMSSRMLIILYFHLSLPHSKSSVSFQSIDLVSAAGKLFLSADEGREGAMKRNYCFVLFVGINCFVEKYKYIIYFANKNTLFAIRR